MGLISNAGGGRERGRGFFTLLHAPRRDKRQQRRKDMETRREIAKFLPPEKRWNKCKFFSFLYFLKLHLREVHLPYLTGNKKWCNICTTPSFQDTPSRHFHLSLLFFCYLPPSLTSRLWYTRRIVQRKRRRRWRRLQILFSFLSSFRLMQKPSVNHSKPKPEAYEESGGALGSGAKRFHSSSALTSGVVVLR